MMWLAAMRIRAACDHVLHANSTLVDRVDLATPLSLSSQRLPASRLLLPRSGLERSDFVLCPQSLDCGGRSLAGCITEGASELPRAEARDARKPLDRQVLCQMRLREHECPRNAIRQWIQR